MRSFLLCLAGAYLLTGCASQAYKDTNAGSFRGELDVRWVKNDFFIFIPNKTDPLTFTRSNGRSVTPGIMYTDGGSIPQFLWGVGGYSPWGYAPAYMIHDWLFEAKHCGFNSNNEYSFIESADTLAEALKTVMERDPRVRSYFVFDSVYAAVKSPIAKKRWDSGECKPPLVESLDVGEPPGELIMTIQFQ